MFKRIRNLATALSDTTGNIGSIGLTLINIAGVVGVYVTNHRSTDVTQVAVATLAITGVVACVLLLNAISRGENTDQRTAAITSAWPFLSVLINTSLGISLTIFLAGDQVATYFAQNPDHLGLMIVAGAATATIFVSSGLYWGFEKLRVIDGLADASATHIVEKVEVSEPRVPSITLRHSESDRKRKAAHFSGRVLCFASSPYLDDDFDFEVSGQYSQITYTADNQVEDEGFLYWMLFQLLSAQQAEVAFSKKASRISWEHYGDIEHYAVQILASRAGASRVILDPQTSAEVEWRTKRIRLFVKETLPKVHSFLRTNQDQLKRIARSTMSGSLSDSELRLILKTVDTSHLPKHWDDQEETGSHLRIVKG